MRVRVWVRRGCVRVGRGYVCKKVRLSGASRCVALVRADGQSKQKKVTRQRRQWGRQWDLFVGGFVRRRRQLG